MIFPRNFLRILMKYVDPVKRRRNINSGRYFRFADLTSDIFFSGPVLEILNSSLGFVYSVGSYLSIECMYRSQNQLGTIKKKYFFENKKETDLRESYAKRPKICFYNAQQFSIASDFRVDTKVSCSPKSALGQNKGRDAKAKGQNKGRDALGWKMVSTSSIFLSPILKNPSKLGQTRIYCVLCWVSNFLDRSLNTKSCVLSGILFSLLSHFTFLRKWSWHQALLLLSQEISQASLLSLSRELSLTFTGIEA